MKYILIALVIIAMLVPAFAQPDPYLMLTGKQMIGTWSGATGYGPWYGDKTISYFGTGKDVSMFYNQTSDTMNLTGKTVVMTGATIGGATVTSGLIADNLITTANKYWKPQAGTGYVNLGLMTGKFLGVAGETDLNVTKISALTVNTTLTQTGIATFTAAPVFNAGIVAPNTQVIDTTTADKLKEAGVIVPTEVPITVQLGNLTNKTVFVADASWTVTSIQERHSVVAPRGATFSNEKLKGTTIPGAWVTTNGVNCMATGSSLTSTINAVVTPALNGTAGNYALVAGDALAIVLGNNAGHPGSLQGDVTIYLKRV